ncbi:hypothetical protein ACQ4PT_068028 [Festuca glaucescens]
MVSPAPATIPEDLLVEIFLRLPTLAALARSAAACTSFRRLIKGRAFRRRYRALHRPPPLGFMDAAGFHPAEAPHPSAPLAGALAPCAEDFSFAPPVVSSASYFSPASYFPVGPDDDELPRWRPLDARDGRVLLDWVSLHLRFVQTSSWTATSSPTTTPAPAPCGPNGSAATLPTSTSPSATPCPADTSCFPPYPRTSPPGWRSASPSSSPCSLPPPRTRASR